MGFKTGDKVRCVKGCEFDNLIEGNVYTVDTCWTGPLGPMITLQEAGPNGPTDGGYYAHRFTLVGRREQQPPMPMADDLFIQAGKEYRTRDGRRARIYASDGAGERIHGAVLMSNGWYNMSWRTDGQMWKGSTSGFDIVAHWTGEKAQAKGYVWLVLKPDGNVVLDLTKEQSRVTQGGDHALACMKVELDEGTWCETEDDEDPDTDYDDDCDYDEDDY